MTRPNGLPRRVILFSGHMVDEQGRDPPRFPERMVGTAAACIAAELDAMGAGPDDLALTQGAAGGDLLFAEAALARGVAVQLLQPFSEAQFVQGSVACRGTAWVDRYHRVKHKLDPQYPIRAAPAELGPLPAGVDAYERCNLWLLHTALAFGTDKVRLIALWNGDGGDAAGGTAHMVAEVKRQAVLVVWIDTRRLG